jgi:outer membrane protein assembly factor BamE
MPSAKLSFRHHLRFREIVLRNLKVLTAVALSAAMLQGCAGVHKVADKLDMKTGTYVAPEKMSTFVKGKTRQADVIASIGYPSSKTELKGTEVWTYPYTLITAIPFVGENKFENTVFEWNKSGVLTNVYKSGGTPGQSGNPMLNAAGM